MIKKMEKIKILIKILKNLYPQTRCMLKFKNPHELLIATRLSAQCTDKKVNEITKVLFKKFDSLNLLANANLTEIYEIIRPCGMGNKKANDIINICKKLIENFDSKIPNTMTQLLTLPGVGRKTANLILATLFNIPTIIVDTHVIKISNRLGLVHTKNPKKIEFELTKTVPPSESINLCHRLVQFGRDFCTAQNPKCKKCPIRNLCCKKIIDKIKKNSI